jgi:hypothetical protein
VAGRLYERGGQGFLLGGGGTRAQDALSLSLPPRRRGEEGAARGRRRKETDRWEGEDGEEGEGREVDGARGIYCASVRPLSFGSGAGPQGQGQTGWCGGFPSGGCGSLFGFGFVSRDA